MQPSFRRLVIPLAAAIAVGAMAAPAAADPADAPSESQIAESRAAGAAAAATVGRANAQLAIADAELDRLSAEVAQAVEAYNGAVWRLQQAQEAAAAAQARAAESAVELADARNRVGRFAASAYRAGGDLGQMSALLEASGPQALVERSSALEAVASHQSDVLDQVRVQEVVNSILDGQAADALAEAKNAAEAVRAAKADAEARVATQQQLLTNIEQTRDAAEADLEAATAQTDALERQRREALARAERERREAAERAAAQAAAERASRAAPAPSRSAAPSPEVVGGNGQRPAPAPSWSPPLTGGSSSGTTSGAQAAIEYARAQIGKPYQWAASGPDRFDCSGLTMRAWQAGGVTLPHWSVAQYSQALKVSTSQARPGDLVFFGSDPTDAGSIYHVGLYIGDGQMIEAPYTGANVRISSVNRASFFGFARP